MAVLTTTARKRLKPSQFGLPGQRAYPMPDAAHARDALSRASEMYRRGKLSGRDKARIDNKAHRMLAALGDH